MTQTQPPEPRAGRPRYEPTDQSRKTVRAMTAYGIEQEQICAVLGITDKTLRKHFRTELAMAAAQANARVAEALYNRALNGDTNAAKFWLQCRAAWREPPLEIGGKDGAPIAVVYSWAEPPEAK
jgi:hypothetical protein